MTPEPLDLTQYLTASECAAKAGIKLRTWTAYVSRGDAPRHDRRELGRRLWHVDKYAAWETSRPGTPGRPRRTKENS